MSDFLPILFLKHNCPFCLKLRIFLLEAGLLQGFEIREFVPGDEREAAIRAELSSSLEKVSFPTLQTAPGKYLADSDAIIGHVAQEEDVDPDSLPVFKSYVEGALKPLLDLFAKARQAGQI